jgi:3-isopropylmalate dehydrogenase
MTMVGDLEPSRITLVPGDGAGPELAGIAREALAALGGIAVREVALGEPGCGPPLDGPALAACAGADAVLLGPVDPTGGRARDAVAALRTALGVRVRLRPASPLRTLLARSPLRPELAAQLRVLFVAAVDPADDPEPVVAAALTAAERRRALLTCVADGGPDSTALRSATERLAGAHDGVVCEHAGAASVARRLATAPGGLDVIVCPATSYGVLAEVAGALSGAHGMLPLGLVGDGPGVFAPLHGPSAPGADVRLANPVGTLAALALLLRHGLGREEPAAQLDRAVEATLAAGLRTPDLAADEPGEREANTLLFGSHLLSVLRRARAPLPAGA